jgi:hypothetical protein
MRFTKLMDDSENVPALPKKKKYGSFDLVRPKWEQLILLHELMKVSSSSLFLCSTDAEHFVLTIGDRNRQQHNSHFQCLMSLLSGELSPFWNSCKMSRGQWLMPQSSASSRKQLTMA